MHSEDILGSEDNRLAKHVVGLNATDAGTYNHQTASIAVVQSTN